MKTAERELVTETVKRDVEYTDSRPATREHILQVNHFLNLFITDLLRRGRVHDASKLVSPEVDYFDRHTARLRTSTYMSPEYKKQITEDLGPALEHHYANNDHHPQFWEAGIQDMSLLHIVEMLMDWWAATLRHETGDIRKSIELNQKRFGYSDDLKRIFHNTIDYMESLEKGLN